ncbi:peptide chain release factor 1-like, mitochondrial [Phlebotomus papatasi]|uniref:peptide chain release factor 1-like, mitochondrial n=1 Tax=Phlebotomus papatasi TaxID=29031 RepID=UPI002484059D|nr:peptide chain release factor 1-like, mitochondrial [Phlebotomus papatasi]
MMFRKLFVAKNAIFLANLRQKYLLSEYVNHQRTRFISSSIQSSDIWENEAFAMYLEGIRKEYSDLQQTSGMKGNRWHELSKMCTIIERRNKVIENLTTLRKIAQEEKDKDFKAMAAEEEVELKGVLQNIHEELLETIVTASEGGYYQSIVMEVTAGVGGKEAMLFTRDLYSMYRNYCDFKGWYTEVLEEDHMEIGGIRHASLCITGEDAFQCLKHEGGVHRVQRIPVTEKSGRVHTSTASVAIIPRPDDVTVTLNSKDLRIETKRASGAGGQHVNTTDSAVRITHIPTGLQVECQTDRSQIKNRELALKKLQARLYESEINAQMASTQNLRSSQVGMSMRNEKIRTYNFNQDRVTDHRIEDGTVHNLKGILEGREILDDFLDNLREKSHKKNLMEFIRRFKD